ncbi:NAD(P)-binding protein [Rhizodiscina lignyota]|uniref:NAD(P)-binding protein n=1 Tax=Rhizodiscina lignyota TaxID=1504668 RepID=A0A9P4IMW8_9PEZI|nr:NAD(P)-binding protein [Rhizodiscina lignyota]
MAAKNDPPVIQDPAIPQGSWVLVTGVNGYIGSHVADQVLAAGYKVRGSVRNAEKAKWLLDLFAPYGRDNFDLVQISDLTAEGAFDEATKDVAGVIHVASITNMNPDPNEVVAPTVAASVNALKAAMKEPSVKRFVYCSSSMAAYTPKNNVPMTITEETWNIETVQAAWAPPPYDSSRSFVVYGASKTQAEQEIWRWYRGHRAERPDFVVNAILPNMNMGQVLDVKSQGIPSTAGFIKLIWDGQLDLLRSMLPPQYYIEVQDDARIHVAALLLPDVKDERIFAFADTFDYDQLLAAFRKVAPNHSFPADVKDGSADLAKVPNGRALELLKRVGRKEWVTLDQAMASMVQSYEEL